MNQYLKFSALLVLLFLTSCGGSKTERFPMDKPFWDAQDYDIVTREIEFHTPEGEQYPTLSNPETGPVFNKLINLENISVVVKDNSLGIRHRSEFASNMFDEYRDLVRIYSVMDREDKFIYDQEIVEILKFGLYLQVYYFKIGNDKIRQESDNENQNKSIISSNEQILVENFNNYLDNINREQAFSSESLQSFASGIDEYFVLLMETFPDAKYNSMLVKAEDMEKKAQQPVIKNSLSNLISKLKSKTESPQTTAVD